MSRLTRKRERQWARYVNHYASVQNPVIGGKSFLRVVWRGLRRKGHSYKYIRRQAAE
jgi:hypothetical protein